MNAANGRALGPQLLALAVFIVALWAQSPEAYAGMMDDGLHLVVAKAIARGDGLHFIHQPHTPPAAFFPPLFAMTVGAIGAAFPNFPANLLLVQIMNAAALAGAVWLMTMLLLSMQLPSTLAYGTAALGFLHVVTLSSAIRSYPEPMLVLLWFGALLTVARAGQDHRWAIAAGAAAGLAALVSYSGWAVLVGVIGGLLVRRHLRAASLAFGVAAALVAPWLIWSIAVGTDPIAQASVASALASASAQWVDATRIVHPSGGGALGAVASAGVCLLAVVGMWRAWMIAPAWVITAITYAASLSVVPITQRSIWVLLPSVVAFAAVGGQWLWNERPRIRRSLAIAGSVVLVAMVTFNLLAVLQHRLVAEPTEERHESSRLFLAGVGTATQETAVVVTDADALLNLYTNRHTLPVELRSAGGAERIDSYCAGGGDYLALAFSSSPQALQVAPPSYVTVFELADGPALYRLACAR